MNGCVHLYGLVVTDSNTACDERGSVGTREAGESRSFQEFIYDTRGILLVHKSAYVCA